MSEFKNKISELRRAAGLTMQKVADTLGVTRQAVELWERDDSRTYPRTANIEKLSLLYNVPVGELIELKNRMREPRSLYNTKRDEANGLGKKITEHRFRLGLSQSQLAEKVGTTDSTISSWETGLSIPVPEFMKRLANVFNISIEELTSDWDGKRAQRNRRRREIFPHAYVGNKLRIARNLKNLNQTQLSISLKITPATISHWENTGTIPKYRIAELSKILGVSENWLTGTEGENSSPESLYNSIDSTGYSREIVEVWAKMRIATQAMNALRAAVDRLIQK